MTRSYITLLALSCVFAVGCPGGDDTKKDDTGPTDDSVPIQGGDEDGDGYTESDGDCDESDPNVNPGADEICDNNDNDCDGEIDEDGSTEYYLDSDEDGYGDSDMSMMACEPDAGYVAVGGDCDDTNNAVYPDAAEDCDGLDNDCDGEIDEDLGITYYRDADGDGYGDEGWTVVQCTDPGEGWLTTGGDCNDAEPYAWTGAAEICDGIDNDCNGVVDDDLSSTWYPDLDRDGYGDESAAIDSCTDPGLPYIATGGDCDDTEADAWTGHPEVCDLVDNDCNGLVDDDAVDATAQVADDDGDGFGSATAVTYACEALVDNTLDCDDGNAREPQVADASASSSGADGSITNPWPTIQEAIDAARMCVVAEAGTYYENIDFGGNDISVTGMDGAGSTTIDGGGAGSVVTFENGETSAASLSGFTITNGGGLLDSVITETADASGTVTYTTFNRYYGGGIFVDGAAPTLSDLIVTDNALPDFSYTVVSASEDEYVYSYGGGVFIADSSGMVLTGVDVTWNFAYMGGGIYASDSASASVEQSSVSYNTGGNGGGAGTQGTLDFTNVIFAGNEADSEGGALSIEGGSSTWWNVTAVGNSGAYGAGVAITDSGTFNFYSSTISDSNSGAGVYGESGASFDAAYSNAYNNDGGDYSGVTDPTGAGGNISADPDFTSWTDNGADDDDLSLASGSALIDAGNPSAAYDDADGTGNDIGAYGGPGSNW